MIPPRLSEEPITSLAWFGQHFNPFKLHNLAHETRLKIQMRGRLGNDRLDLRLV
jgi:hypothetical protein